LIGSENLRFIIRTRSCLPYIGDGATLTRSFIRKRGERLIGHAAISVQIGWCAKKGVPRAIITHCGSEIVTGDERNLAARLRAMGAERGVETRIAHDGMELVLWQNKSDARTAMIYYNSTKVIRLEQIVLTKTFI
jgi:hypothetical protein